MSFNFSNYHLLFGLSLKFTECTRNGTWGLVFVSSRMIDNRKIPMLLNALCGFYRRRKKQKPSHADSLISHWKWCQSNRVRFVFEWYRLMAMKTIPNKTVSMFSCQLFPLKYLFSGVKIAISNVPAWWVCTDPYYTQKISKAFPNYLKFHTEFEYRHRNSLSLFSR